MNLDSEIKKRQEKTRQFIFDLLKRDNKPSEANASRAGGEKASSIKNKHEIGPRSNDKFECFEFKRRVSNVKEEKECVSVNKPHNDTSSYEPTEETFENLQLKFEETLRDNSAILESANTLGGDTSSYEKFECFEFNRRVSNANEEKEYPNVNRIKTNLVGFEKFEKTLLGNFEQTLTGTDINIEQCQNNLQELDKIEKSLLKDELFNFEELPEPIKVEVDLEEETGLASEIDPPAIDQPCNKENASNEAISSSEGQTPKSKRSPKINRSKSKAKVSGKKPRIKKENLGTKEPVAYDIDGSAKKCRECPYVTHKKSRIDKHVRGMHSIGKERTCSRCGFKTTTFGAWKDHFASLKDDPNHQKKRKRTTMVKCPHCNYGTYYSFYLRHHIKAVHEKLRELQCDRCEFNTAHPKSLRMHVKTAHDGIKNLLCKECSYATARRDDLKRHVTVIHGERIYNMSCDKCDFRTYHKGNLYHHIKNSHEDHPNNVLCDKCNYSTKSTSHLREHTKAVHDKVKDYKCLKCAFETTTERKLFKHTKRHIKREMDIEAGKLPKNETKWKNGFAIKPRLPLPANIPSEPPSAALPSQPPSAVLRSEPSSAVLSWDSATSSLKWEKPSAVLPQQPASLVLKSEEPPVVLPSQAT